MVFEPEATPFFSEDRESPFPPCPQQQFEVIQSNLQVLAKTRTRTKHLFQCWACVFLLIRLCSTQSEPSQCSCSARRFPYHKFGTVTLFMNSKTMEKLCWGLIRISVCVLVNSASQERKLWIN